MIQFNHLLNVMPQKSTLIPNQVIEVEVKFKPLITYKHHTYFSRLLSFFTSKKYPIFTENTTVYYFPNNVRKVVNEDNSFKVESKKRIYDDRKYEKDYQFVTSISSETLLNVDTTNLKVNFVRHRTRTSIKLNENYQLDLTFVDNKYEFELEYVGDLSQFNVNELSEMVFLVYSVMYQTKNLMKQSDIDTLSLLIKKYNVEKSSLVQARNIKYVDLVNKGIVNNEKTGYAVAHKADGLRKLLIFNNQSVWLVYGNDYNLYLTDQTFNLFSVYECELVEDLVLIYDTLVFEGKNMRTKPLLERRKFIKLIAPQFQLKDVKTLTLDNFFDTMTQMFEEQLTLPYPQDGFIFTPLNLYNYHSNDLPLFKRRLVDQPDVCKYKPPHLITIDFRVVITDKIELHVFSNKAKKEVPFKGSKKSPLTNISDEFLPYPNLIVESRYDPLCNIMLPVKVRYDKDGPNQLDIAEANWKDINDPILKEDILGQSLELVKKYHNQIKSLLYGLPTIYAPLDYKLPVDYTLLDIGGGRGGDIDKWLRSGAAKIFTVEPNNDNLRVLNERLKNVNLNVTTINTVGEDTVKIVEVVKQKVDVISLMLSLSFFYASEAHLDALINTIVHNLKLGGIVIFLTIDGKKLNFVNDEIIIGDASFKKYDRFIRVKIPGIVDKQWEWLVDLGRLTIKLRQYGVTLMETRPATDELLLSTENIKYTSLFTYGYYQKIKEVKLPPLKTIALPSITFPTIPPTILNLLNEDESEQIDAFIRIGAPIKDSFLSSILKAYSDYPIDDFKIYLSQTLDDDLWTKHFKNWLLQQIKDKNDKVDYTLLGLKYYLQYDDVDERFIDYIADVINYNIYILKYDEGFVVDNYHINCRPNHGTILLLKIGNHYELLTQKDVSIFTNEFDYKFKLPIKNKIEINISDEEITNALHSDEPLYKEVIKKSNIDLYIKALASTINKNYIVDNINESVKKVFSNETTLSEILKGLPKKVKKEGRASERVDVIDRMVKKLNINTKNIKVLDIGAGKGDIIKAVKDYYKLKEVYAIDVKLPKIKDVKTLMYDKNGNIPLDNNSIDLILIFNVLHHIPMNIRNHLIDEVNRVLKPGGIIIIREHDDDKTTTFKKFIELIHDFWYLYENEAEDPLNMFNIDELKNMFSAFNLIDIERYNDPNPQRIYHAVLQKPFTDFPYFKTIIDPNDLMMRFNNLKTYKFETKKVPYTIKNIPGHFYKNKKLKYNELIIVNKSEDYLKYNLISDYFIDECKVLAKRFDRPLTPLEYWEQNKTQIASEALAKYKVVNNKTLREVVYEKAGEVTTFRPTLMVGFIKMFNAKRVLDFSAGWGDRLIGAAAANVDLYVGVDPNTCVFNKYKEIIDFFKLDKSKFMMINEPFETATLPDKTFDLICTSSPYFSLESYSDEKTQSIFNRDLTTWFDDFLMTSLFKAWEKLVSKGHMVIIINDMPNENKFVQNMVEIFNQNVKDAQYLGVISYSEFKNNLPINPQGCWIWSKK